jgi:hypothetical protein
VTQIDLVLGRARSVIESDRNRLYSTCGWERESRWVVVSTKREDDVPGGCVERGEET